MLKMRQVSDHLTSPWGFFIIAVGFSWLYWVPATFVDENILDTSWVILLCLGGIGPAVGGILLTYLNKEKEYQRQYWQRVFNPKRIGGKWYLLILFAYPFLTILIALADQGQVQISETLKELLAQPIRIFPFAIFIFLFGPFPEELGWRGYALYGLQRRMNAVWASLVLGAVWAIWHVPLFFMNGTYQNELGFGSAAFWRFMLFVIVSSIFFNWIYNNNQRSTLSASLFHFSINFTGNILTTSGVQETYRLIVLTFLAMVVSAIYGVKDLSSAKQNV